MSRGTRSPRSPSRALAWAGSALAVISIVAFGGTLAFAGTAPSEVLKSDALYKRLVHRLAARIGDERFACLVGIDDAYENRVGFSLRITTKLAFNAARRAQRSDASIQRIEIVPPRYSLRAMRRVSVAARSELRAFPKATVQLVTVLGEERASRGRCAPAVKITVAGESDKALLAGAQRVQSRYGADRVRVLVESLPAVERKSGS
jgi:hypothetical protein